MAQRWLETLAVVTTVYFLERSAAGAYMARVFAAIIIAFWLWRWLGRHHPSRLNQGRVAHWTATLGYSAPLVFNEISGSLLGLLDRLMLKLVLNDFVPVGIFAVGAGLASTLNSVVNQAMSVAFTQVSMRQYALEGPAAVVKTKRATLHVMIYAVVLLVSGIVCVGADFLVMLAGPDKTASAPVFVWMSCSYLVAGMIDLAGSGLLLLKRSKTVLALNVVATIVTTAVNLLLIPRCGVAGAIYATLAGYVVLGPGQFMLCPRELRALPPTRAILTALALGALLYFLATATHLFGIERPMWRFLAMAPLSLVVFVLPAVCVDPVLRNHTLRLLGRRHL